MSFDERRKTKKPDPQHFLKTGDGLKRGNYYDKYALYRKNAEQIDPNLPDLDPEYGEVYTNNIEEHINYLNPRSMTKSTRGGRRRRMKQTKRRRRKQTKRTR